MALRVRAPPRANATLRNTVAARNLATNKQQIRSFTQRVSLQQLMNQPRKSPLTSAFTTMPAWKQSTIAVPSIVQRFAAQRNLTTIDPKIQEHYEKAHAPIITSKPYGEPYTDTKALEQIPVYHSHHVVETFGDKLALGLVNFFKVFTHFFFRDKYTHHAVVLETVAAVPGMVAGMLRHFKSLRRMERDHGWIGKLLEEAENERMHLLTWMQVIRPSFTERLLVFGAQCFYAPFYTLIYLFSPRTAHRFVGYLEEEAVHEYTMFLKAIDEGKIVNVAAPEIAKKYWNLAPDAKLRDVVLAVRADEVMHRDVNHLFSDKCHMGQH